MRQLVVPLCALAVGFSACGPAAPTTHRVAGTVTFDGKPLEKGYIILKPTAPGERAEGAEINGGRYEVRALAGAKKVEITAERETGKVNSKGVKLIENYIPAAYNTATTLQVTVTAEGPNEFDFTIKAGP